MPTDRTTKKTESTKKNQTIKKAKTTVKKPRNTTKKTAVSSKNKPQTQKNKGEAERRKKIENEVRRLTAIFSGASSERKRLLREPIRDAAFASVMMQELSKTILDEGVEIEYQNGANQFGKKQSPAAQLYLQFSQKLTQNMKFLNEALPKEQAPEKKPEDDGFDAFVLGREDV